MFYTSDIQMILTDYLKTMIDSERIHFVKNTLREQREKHGFTQDELADLVGVSRQTIISLEKGKYDPSIRLAFKLSKTLKTAIEDIFLYEYEMESHE